MTENQKVSKAELEFIRSLCDFDLTMLVSEIHDHGWPQARKLLPMIKEAIDVHGNRRISNV